MIILFTTTLQIPAALKVLPITIKEIPTTEFTGRNMIYYCDRYDEIHVITNDVAINS